LGELIETPIVVGYVEKKRPKKEMALDNVKKN
jgi:hypothetical protein